jgi:probable HAF family extracellular repeat protein
MKSRAQYVNGAARMISRAGWSHRLTSAGVACLGLALAGWGGLTAAEAQNTYYTVQDLGVVGQNFSQPGQPFEITNNGWVSGGAGVGAEGAAPEHAVLWHQGSMIDIGNPGLGGNSIAYAVNELGLAVGEAEDTAKDPSTTEDFCGFEFMGYTSSPTPCVPFIWNGRKMVPLKTLGGVNGVATWINSYGVIAGYAENTTPDSTCAGGGNTTQIYQFKPVVWYGSWIQPLATTGRNAEGVPFSDPDGVALAVNDLGRVVGSTGTCTAFSPISLNNLQPVHAVLWENGLALDLGSLPGESNYEASNINNRGEVVGGSATEAFLWTPEKGMQGLGYVDNDNSSSGIGINDKGEIVGVSANFSPEGAINTIRGFVRQNGTLVDLNTLIVGSNPFPQSFSTNVGPTGLVTACHINSNGEIDGIAVDPAGVTHAYLAIPTHD